jgi:hypothetical protein
VKGGVSGEVIPVAQRIRRIAKRRAMYIMLIVWDRISLAATDGD